MLVFATSSTLLFLDSNPHTEAVLTDDVRAHFSIFIVCICDRKREGGHLSETRRAPARAFQLEVKILNTTCSYEYKFIQVFFQGVGAAPFET